MKRLSVEEVLSILETVFPNAQSDLVFHNRFELLIAVMLSAQTTDKAVNKVTPALFLKYPDAAALSKANSDDVEPFIQSIGLYRSKAKNIVKTSELLMELGDGSVPSDFDTLLSLPGVGRKTANVIRAVGFDIPAIAVDTHVERVAKRLGWAKQKDTVLEVEKALMKKIPKDRWAEAHHLLLLFGRYYSTARNNQNVYELLNELKEKQNG